MTEKQVTRRSFISAAAAAGVAAVGAGLAGCSSSGSDAGSSSASTGSGTVKPVILVTSFGTSYNDSRHITIGAIEDDVREAFPDYEVRRAFTAQTIIDIIEERDGRTIQNFEDAVQSCIDDGVKELVVQPTHLMGGYEYTDISDALDEVSDQFDSVALGDPLLTSDDDKQAVIEAITSATADYDDGDTAIVFMGHGTEADSNSVYAEMQELLTQAGYDNYFITTVEAEPSFDDTIALVKETSCSKVVLRPFMVVAGDHANNDMADTEDSESLASKFIAEGYEVTSVIEGLGQLVDIDEIYVSHVQAAIDSLA